MTTHPDATEMEAAVADVLKIWDHERNAEAVTSAARLLWDALADLGMVDDFGGLQCERVLPEALAFIGYEANRQRQGPPFPGAAGVAELYEAYERQRAG